MRARSTLNPKCTFMFFGFYAYVLFIASSKQHMKSSHALTTFQKLAFEAYFYFYRDFADNLRTPANVYNQQPLSSPRHPLAAFGRVTHMFSRSARSCGRSEFSAPDINSHAKCQSFILLCDTANHKTSSPSSSTYVPN